MRGFAPAKTVNMSTHTTRLRMMASLRRIAPVKLILLGYLSYALVGWVLLCLPVCHEPVTTGGEEGGVAALDNLFIAASAMSTTGLITVNTPLAYSFWGELVIVSLIQLGGIGYMTLGSFIVLAGRHRLSRFREKMTAAAFALPEGFKPATFVTQVIVFTLLIEAAGAVAFYFAFLNAGVAGRGAEGAIGASFSGQAHLVWQAIFHSISAFCTAGFSLFPDSLESYRPNVWINLIASVLALLGALGFIVMSDVAGSLSGLRRRVTLTTRIILIFTFWIIVAGAAFLFFAEPTIAELPNEERVLAAWFQSMTALTTVGFNTHPYGKMAAGPVLVVIVLMVMGASPSGTGGGLKSTSVSAVWATIRSVLKGRKEITFFGHRVPTYRLNTAFATLGLYVLVLLTGSILLLLTESPPASLQALGEVRAGIWAFEDYLFEAASALGTVGLSRGVTGDLTSLGKLVIVAMMLIGRVGPLTFSLALMGGQEGEPLVPAGEADIAV